VTNASIITLIPFACCIQCLNLVAKMALLDHLYISLHMREVYRLPLDSGRQEKWKNGKMEDFPASSAHWEGKVKVVCLLN
jgi:hypothetical protein